MARPVEDRLHPEDSPAPRCATGPDWWVPRSCQRWCGPGAGRTRRPPVQPAAPAGRDRT